MKFQIRLAQPALDFPRIAELLSLVSTDPVTAEGLHEDEDRIIANKIRRRWVAVDEHDTVIGCAMIVKYPSQPADMFHLELVVDPAHRQQGIGSKLYEDALQFATEHGMGRLYTEVVDNDDLSRQFATARGFEISHHVFDSSLDLASFDEKPFAGIIESVEATGIRFTTLAAEGNTQEAQDKLYAINRMAGLHEPGSSGGFPIYDTWRKIILEASWFRSESQFIALDGDQYVGLSGVYNEPGQVDMFNGIAGIEPAYRGRKIALALKLLTIQYAREHGARLITTGNDARNAPMLAINRKLGYQPLPGHYVLCKQIKDSDPFDPS